VLKPATIRRGTSAGGKTLSNLVVKFYFPAALFPREPTAQLSLPQTANKTILLLQ
jgi:hypothetical protein